MMWCQQHSGPQNHETLRCNLAAMWWHLYIVIYQVLGSLAHPSSVPDEQDPFNHNDMHEDGGARDGRSSSHMDHDISVRTTATTARTTTTSPVPDHDDPGTCGLNRPSASNVEGKAVKKARWTSVTQTGTMDEDQVWNRLMMLCMTTWKALTKLPIRWR